MSIASKQTEVKYLKTGRRGMLPYPAGEWTAEATYTATENVAPYVLRNGTYYVMNKVGSVKGLDPQTDYGKNGQQATWIPFEEYKAVYVELLMARLGLIGKSVFWDNYTFSQKGVDDKGQPSDQYQNFEAGTFTPNILIDWVEGTIRLLKLVAEGADIEGVLTAATGSKIAGMEVMSSFLRFLQGNKEVRLGHSVYPMSSSMSGAIYIKDTSDDTLGRTAVYVEVTADGDESLDDARSYSKALNVEKGAVRVAPYNLMDVPGVLVAGMVYADGATGYQFGRKRLYIQNRPGNYMRMAYTVDTPASSGWIQYLVRHNLGHSNYVVQITPYSGGTDWRKFHAHVVDKQNDFFVVVLLDSGKENTTIRGDFTFVMVGDN